jgi:hypothetical protein
VQSLGQADQILLSRFPFDSARQALKGEELHGIEALSWLNHGPYPHEGGRGTPPLHLSQVKSSKGAQQAAWQHEMLLLTFNTDGDPAMEVAAVGVALERGDKYAVLYQMSSTEVFWLPNCSSKRGIVASP